MLAAAQRLRRRDEFTTAFRAGRRAGRGAVVVHLSLPSPADLDEPASAAPTARAGFVVSKAVGGAVVRNQVKRRLRHLTRERIGTLPAGATLVVRALPAAADRSYQGLGVDLDKALAAVRGPRKRREGS
ncbi:ribonuclease P protein component [Asanoa sp. WMMD1127]|uniref:ribonuclease P protein component n=1 Tax=Asanoa sp. WMMD1127 TaxID=3016107 RepID=UPI0024173E94|nr:ribonuclease P protein component [Asanoa sp. WMMD1127]MDG4822173.1 ribonuclease P protein component [Asanoa sp. WMMD1127]